MDRKIRLLYIVESMYMRKPCVVSDVIGNHDETENGNNGYICSTLQEFIGVIQDIRCNKAPKIVDNAYSDILKEYNVQTMADKYSKIYELTKSNRGCSNEVIKLSALSDKADTKEMLVAA